MSDKTFKNIVIGGAVVLGSVSFGFLLKKLFFDNKSVTEVKKESKPPVPQETKSTPVEDMSDIIPIPQFRILIKEVGECIVGNIMLAYDIIKNDYIDQNPTSQTKMHTQSLSLNDFKMSCNLK